MKTNNCNDFLYFPLKMIFSFDQNNFIQLYCDLVKTFLKTQMFFKLLIFEF